MSFSVLISVYHKEQGEFLRLSLESVMTQTLMPNEVIIVKDGPLTAELDLVCDEFIERYPDIFKIIALPENVGLGRALNEGLKHCSYDLVARMDSDDISKPNRFMAQVELMKNRLDISVVGSWVEPFENSVDNILACKKRPTEGFELLAYAQKRTPLCHPTVMFRKKDIISVGSYQHIHLMEDYYLWMRLIKAGYKLYNIQDSLLYFRTSQDVMKRRGGLRYALNEFRLFNFMRKQSLISWQAMICNMLMRFPVRIMPSFIRGYVYKRFLFKIH